MIKNEYLEKKMPYNFLKNGVSNKNLQHIYDNIRLNFPCIDCITFPICKNELIMNINNDFEKVKKSIGYYVGSFEFVERAATFGECTEPYIEASSIYRIFQLSLYLKCHIVREHVYNSMKRISKIGTECRYTQNMGFCIIEVFQLSKILDSIDSYRTSVK